VPDTRCRQTKLTGFAVLSPGLVLFLFWMLRGGGESPSATGWLLAPLGLGMLIV
jgi:hypothetical protein